MLKRQGVIEAWHDRRIGAGEDLHDAISDHVENDDILLLLVSPDFLASDYCYDREMTRAMERHAAGSAVVIPVILRPCDWADAPFSRLMATPTDGRPVTQWPDRDEAFLKVAQAIRSAIEQIQPEPTPRVPPSSIIEVAPRVSAPRSSNLRLAKSFTELDRDRFRIEAFDYMAKFFENSLDELASRNTGIEGQFRRIDSNRFTAAIYRDGKAITRCTIFMGGDSYMSSGINFLHGETSSSNSYNESVTVNSDDQSMYLESLMSRHHRSDHVESKLTHEGAAEHYWSMLVEPLQRQR